MTGVWAIDVPVEFDETEHDRQLLEQIDVPEGVTLLDMKVVIHGRVWEYQRIETVR